MSTFDAYLAQLGVPCLPPRLHEMGQNLSQYVQGACAHCGHPRHHDRGPILVDLDSRSLDDFFYHANCAAMVLSTVAYLNTYCDVHLDAPSTIN
jgi:hypothetical protein